MNATVNIPLDDMLAGVRREVAAQILAEHSDDLALIDIKGACAVLKISRYTLAKLPIPRVALTTDIVRYRLSDIAAYIAANVER